MRILACVVLALALVAAACSTGSEDIAVVEDPTSEQRGDGAGGQASSDTPLDDAELIDLVASLAADVGDEGVFAAVALALDRGYSVAQLAGAAGTGAVSADGTIVGIDPAGEPFELLAKTAVPSLRLAGEPVASVDELAEGIAPQGPHFTGTMLTDRSVLAGVLLTLVQMGYTMDQIVEGILFGELSVLATASSQGRGCIGLVDSTGSVVVPEVEPAEENIILSRAYTCGSLARAGSLRTLGTAPEADEPEAEPTEEGPAEVPSGERRYEGIANISLVYEDSVNQPPLWQTRTCQNFHRVQLTLRPDGTAQLQLQWSTWVNSPGTGGEDCEAADWTSLVDGTWTEDGSSFTVGVADPISGSISTVTGTFGDDQANLPLTDLYFLVFGDQPVTGDVFFDIERVTQ